VKALATKNTKASLELGAKRLSIQLPSDDGLRRFRAFSCLSWFKMERR